MFTSILVTLAAYKAEFFAVAIINFIAEIVSPFVKLFSLLDFLSSGFLLWKFYKDLMIRAPQWSFRAMPERKYFFPREVFPLRL